MTHSLAAGTRSFLVKQLILSTPIATQAQRNEANPVVTAEKQQDGVFFTMKSGLLKLRVCTDRIVRILYTPTFSFPNCPDYVVLKSAWPPRQWTTETAGDTVVIATTLLRVTVSKRDGVISFTDSSGRKLFGDYSRTMTPVEVNGEKTWHTEMLSNLW
jgi:hypothetical protein